MIGWTAVGRSLSQFRTNPLRTMLTLLGMVFGVGSVVAMVSIGEGAQEEILRTIEAMGANNMHVRSRAVDEGSINEVINDSAGLSRADVQALWSMTPGVVDVAYRSKLKLGVTDLKLPPHAVGLYGVSRNLMDVHGLTLSSGRSFRGVDFRSERRVAILGADLAERLYPQGAVGQQVRLQFSYFEVIGVLEERTALGGDVPVDPEVYNMAVLIPFETADVEIRPARPYAELDVISVRVGSTDETLVAKQIAEATLRRRHGGVEDFDVIAPEEILQQKKGAQSVLNIVLISIAAISLVVGGIGVMNIMLANIMERIHEIGLRRAVGARRGDIRNQFLFEAVLICVVGGVVGIVMGTGLSFVVASIFELPIAFAWESMVLAFGISVFVGVLFGIVPAIRAANVNPIEALQRE